MTIADLNALGYYVCSLGQTCNLGKFWCSVRPCSQNSWSGRAYGDTIEEAIANAYECCVELQTTGRTKHKEGIAEYYNLKQPQIQLSLEDLGMVKPLKRRSLNENRGP